jgi:hypothetical protein
MGVRADVESQNAFDPKAFAGGRCVSVPPAVDGLLDAPAEAIVAAHIPGGLSRTQTSQLGAKEGFELRLWVL